jgi:twitching motility protein PilI
MANKDALRELQTRLAERLQAARAAGVGAAWLACEAGGRRYLFPLGQSGEIVPWIAPQAVPYVLPWFLGVANVRGDLYGVVDLASFATGKPPRAVGEMARTQMRMLGFNAALDMRCLLLVDRLAGLKQRSGFVSSHKANADSPAYFGHVFLDEEGVEWQEINLQLLAETPEFLGIAA